MLIDAGQQGRRLHAIPSTTHAINQQLRNYGNTTRARSRYLSLNDSYMSNARESFIDAAIGCGIVPSPQTPDLALRAILRERWDDWTDYCDADALTDFYGLQAMVAGEEFEAGEVFVRFRPRYPTDGFLVPLQIQILPAEMLPLDRNQDLGNGRRIEMGVQFNAIGQREGYWFLTRHPGGDVTSPPAGAQEVFVPASEVLHIYRPRNAGQVRGLTHTAPAITTTAMINLYDDAEQERKKNAALFGGFVTRPAETADDDDHPFADTRPPLPQNPELDTGIPPGYPPAGYDIPYDAAAWGKVAPGTATLEPGALIDLDEGEDIKFSEPADLGNSYEPYQYRALTRLAAGVGVPYMEVTGDLKQANYSSLRAGRVAYKRRTERTQYGVFVHQLCRAVWLRWLQTAVLAGAIDNLTPAQYLARQPEVSKVRWRVPPWESHDPQKDAAKDQSDYNLRLKPISTMIEERGDEPEEVFDQFAADQKSLDERGIPPPAVNTKISPTTEVAEDTGSGGGNSGGNDPPPDDATNNNGGA
jgi:lambda family phage portal protein